VATFKPGLVHTPVTPFNANESIDFDRYARVLEFHLAHGAQALALPMHAGESVSLSDAERGELLEFAIRRVAGRVPVIGHASQSGSEVAAELARHAAKAGAAAVIATPPYYWTPPANMLLEHFTIIGKAAGVPFYIYHSPEEMGGVEFKVDLVMNLIERLPNFTGVIDVSMDWQFMIDAISNAQRVRPEFQLLTGVEYLISASACGATGMLAPLAGIAPRAVHKLWKLCSREDYPKARPVQEVLADLNTIVKPLGVSALKSGMRLMNRDSGQPRAPLEAVDAAGDRQMATRIGAIPLLREEPRGW
jgi:4-hydroxy-tetrahydrodipicolinate synthase